jgi:hypothetical protein
MTVEIHCVPCENEGKETEPFDNWKEWAFHILAFHPKDPRAIVATHNLLIPPELDAVKDADDIAEYIAKGRMTREEIDAELILVKNAAQLDEDELLDDEEDK